MFSYKAGITRIYKKTLYAVHLSPKKVGGEEGRKEGRRPHGGERKGTGNNL